MTVVITIRIKDAPKIEECLRRIFEDAGAFPHPDYEDFDAAIEALQSAEISILPVGEMP